MLYTTNKDIPCIIGTLGHTIGEYDVNIANFTFGRKNTGGDAIALLYLDCAPNKNAMDSLQKTGIFQTVSALKFEV